MVYASTRTRTPKLHNNNIACVYRIGVHVHWHTFCGIQKNNWMHEFVYDFAQQQHSAETSASAPIIPEPTKHVSLSRKSVHIFFFYMNSMCAVLLFIYSVFLLFFLHSEDTQVGSGSHIKGETKYHVYRASHTGNIRSSLCCVCTEHFCMLRFWVCCVQRNVMWCAVALCDKQRTDIKLELRLAVTATRQCYTLTPHAAKRDSLHVVTF